MADAAPDGIGVAWQVGQGPRPEVQDVPLYIRMRFDGDGWVTIGDGRPRDPDVPNRDLVITGLLDGIGGCSVKLDFDRLHAIAPLIDPRLLTENYRAPGTYLTGRAASQFLARAIERRAARLRPGPSGYGIEALLADVHDDLASLNELFHNWGVSDGGPRARLGAALTLAVIDPTGKVLYANCGDCRCGVIRADGSAVELSTKQTIAALIDPGDQTTVGRANDHKVLNAVGVVDKLQPALATAELGPDDFLVHLTDGAKEALMHAAELESIPWDARTLPVTLKRAAVPQIEGETRCFPAAHRLFSRGVLPHVAEPGSKDFVTKVHDNVSVMVVQRCDPVTAALDHLYQGIDDGTVAIRRSPFEIERAQLDAAGRAAGLDGDDELSAFFAAAAQLGLAVVW